MIRCFFKAKARYPIFSVHDLDIMRAGIRYSQRNGVTGFLLREDNTYLSIVEGEPAAIESLLLRVDRDDRVFDLQVISRHTTQERQYPSWSMGYTDSRNPCGKSKVIRDFLQLDESSCTQHMLNPVLEGMKHLCLRQEQKDQRLRNVEPARPMAEMVSN